MKSAIVLGLFGLVVSSVACSASSSAPSDVGASNANRLVLDVRCAVDTDCPAGFECEVEAQNGVSQSDCRSRDAVPAGTAGGSKGLDDDAGAPTGVSTGACVTNADCPIGLECQIELGVASCKAHGGKK